MANVERLHAKVARCAIGLRVDFDVPVKAGVTRESSPTDMLARPDPTGCELATLE